MSEHMIIPCCPKFIEQAALKALAGGGFMYPPSERLNAQMEYDSETQLWNVNGCCGGGCYVLEDLEFCPWCKSELPKPMVT